MRFHAACALTCSAIVLPTTGYAQILPAAPVVAGAIARACQGNAGKVLTPERLAEALVVEARVAPTLAEMSDIAREIATTQTSRRINTSYIAALRMLQSSLARAGSSEAKAILVTPPPPPWRAGAPNWLFDPNYTLTCAPASAPRTAEFTELQALVVRGSIDALDEIGKEKQAAAAAQIGWQETRVTNLEDQTTRTETFTVDATIGYAFGNVDRNAIVYADYSRNRVETRKDGGEADVDDVEALEVGVSGTTRFGAVRTSGRIGVTLDEVTKARYLRGNLRLVPITGGRGNLGFCNINSYRTITTGLRGRCTFVGEIELRDVLRRGSADIGATDILAALGGTAGIEIGPGIDADGNIEDGIVASARYTYLAVIEGDLPDIDRFEANISYRWWVGDLGFDVGLTYADGTERKSFADENRFGFRVGVIY